MVSLTGSVETGKWIAEHAARTLKEKVHLELGGKAPVVVFDDVDLNSVLETIAGTGYYNAGQDCTAATRVLASSAKSSTTSSTAWPRRPTATSHGRHELSRHDARPGELRAPARACRRLPRAPALAPPRSSPAAKQPDLPGFFLQPDGRKRPAAGRRDDPEERSSARSSRSSRSPTRKQAIKWANGTPYGLASSVWTRDVGRALRVSKALRFGTVWINDHIPLTRCPTAATASRATARTCRCTPSRTTRTSSTSWRR